MCIVLAAPSGPETWRIRRLVELMAYRPALEEVEILFGIYADNNNADGEPNVLKMLHPGNVRCEEIQAWPLPRHPDEHQDRTGILEEIYGPVFFEQNNELYQKQTLSAWDSWQDVIKQRVYTLNESQVMTRRLTPDFITPTADEYVPFTAWTLGPFSTHGAHLLTFRMSYLGDNYRQVVLPYDTTDFRIDGPEQIYKRIKLVELPGLAASERTTWEDRLTPFDNHRLSSGEGYDILLLQTKSRVEVGELLGAVQAPIQPSADKEAERFISAHESFSLELRLK